MNPLRLHPKLDALLYPTWVDKIAAQQAMSEAQKLPWLSEFIYMYGRKIEVPRKVLWIADTSLTYTYSGIQHKPVPWPNWLFDLRQKINTEFNCQFNSVLANFYANGSQYMGYHRDNERALGKSPIIASVSLGVERKFVFKHMRSEEKVEIKLPSGSLLLMWGNSQHAWQHALPKMRGMDEARVNLTFRTIKDRQLAR